MCKMLNPSESAKEAISEDSSASTGALKVTKGKDGLKDETGTKDPFRIVHIDCTFKMALIDEKLVEVDEFSLRH